MRIFEVGVYALPLRVLICSRSGKRVYETPRIAKKITGDPMAFFKKKTLTGLARTCG
jgi:hypothetical protein